MADSRFFLTRPALSFAEALARAGAHAAGRGGEGFVARIAAADDADLSGAAIFVEEKRVAAAYAGGAALVLTTAALASPLAAAPLGVAASPRLAFARLAAALHEELPLSDAAGVDPAADVAPTARVHATATVSAGARIGAGAVLEAQVVVGPGVVVGEGCRIGAGASLFCAVLGAGVVVKPGARVGQAGFGFAPGPDGLVRMPQIGRVLVGDFAEIGANSCVDRGALGDTVIESGAKIDNLVQIAHNVRVGASAAIAAQAGVSGSTTIGKGALLGGKAGLADHLAIGDGAQIAAAAGVMRDVPPGERWGGTPARPMRQWFRETAALARLAQRGKNDDAD